MNKISEKRLTIYIPEILLKDFKIACSTNYKTMSDTLRDFIQNYIQKTKEEK